MSALPDIRIDDFDVSVGVHTLPRSTPFKRAVDVVVGSIALIVALPVMACLVVIIRLDSRGPAFYGQRRIGYLGRPFTLWKLRSMYHQSSQAYHLQAARDWFQEHRSGERYKTELDPRSTRVGRYLRRSHLDNPPHSPNLPKLELNPGE